MFITFLLIHSIDDLFIYAFHFHSAQRVNSKELPHYVGYMRKALKTVAGNLIGEELHGFALKVP